MKKYEDSGALGMAPLIMPLIGGVAATIIGLVYAYILVWSPIVGYVNVIALGAVAFGVAMVAHLGAHLGKLRNATVGLVLGIGIGVWALYAHWAFFVYALLSRFDDTFEPGMFDVLLSPAGVWEFTQIINEEGWYEIFGIQPSGIFAWLLWAVEAGAILVGGALGGAMSLGPFCEACGKWCEEDELDVRFHVPEGSFAQDLEGKSLDELKQLEPAGPHRVNFVGMEIMQCAGCSTMRTYQLKHHHIETDSDGDASEKEDEIGDRYLLQPDEYDGLKEWVKTAAPPA